MAEKAAVPTPPKTDKAEPAPVQETIPDVTEPDTLEGHEYHEVAEGVKGRVSSDSEKLSRSAVENS